MVMPVEFPAVAAPMVRPVTVTVTALPAGMLELEVVTTMNVLPPPKVGVPEDVTPLGATKPADVTAVKKPEGKDSVMVLPVASAPPAVVVNENVAAADVLPAKRSDADIANEGLVA